LLAKDDHKVRIEVGYGLEGALTGVKQPHHRRNHGAAAALRVSILPGINAGVDQVIRVVDGEPLPPPDTHWQQHGLNLHNALPLLLFAFVFGSACCVPYSAAPSAPGSPAASSA
jgi:uncharacterized protein